MPCEATYMQQILGAMSATAATCVTRSSCSFLFSRRWWSFQIFLTFSESLQDQLGKILNHSWASFASCFLIWCVHAFLLVYSLSQSFHLQSVISRTVQNSVLGLPRLPAQQRLCPSWHQARELSAPKQRSRCDLVPVELKSSTTIRAWEQIRAKNA